MSNLMLGGGAETQRYQAFGWTVLDASWGYQPDFVANVPPLPPEVTGKEWTTVCAIHFIEHLFLEDAARLIKEIHGILADGGLLILEQADIGKVMRFALGDERPPVEKYPWMKGDESWFGMRNLYPQKDMIDDNLCNMHRSGHTPASLWAMVVRCGFDGDKVALKSAVTHVRERDFRLEARK